VCDALLRIFRVGSRIEILDAKNLLTDKQRLLKDINKELEIQGKFDIEKTFLNKKENIIIILIYLKKKKTIRIKSFSNLINNILYDNYILGDKEYFDIKMIKTSEKENSNYILNILENENFNDVFLTFKY
jgi:hypothetical protein